MQQCSVFPAGRAPLVMFGVYENNNQIDCRGYCNMWRIYCIVERSCKLRTALGRIWAAPTTCLGLSITVVMAPSAKVGYKLKCSASYRQMGLFFMACRACSISSGILVPPDRAQRGVRFARSESKTIARLTGCRYIRIHRKCPAACVEAGESQIDQQQSAKIFGK